jgi:hypothetical protein
MDRKNHRNSGTKTFRPFNPAREEKAIRQMRNVPPEKGPRYVVKFVNDIWTIFDTHEFRNCEPDLGSKEAAEALLNS